jgi:ABC-type ATPase involved in cell division
VRFDRVSFSYGHTAILRDVSLTLLAGELAYLVGPSAAGKTTLLELAHGQRRPSAGLLQVDGVLLHRERPGALRRLRRSVGFVSQDHRLLPRLTALDNVAYALRVAELRLGGRDARQRAGRALAEVGLEHRLDAYPGELSGGQRQRVAVARALAGRPSILLADEPTANLDAESTGNVLELLRRCATQGAAVLVATCDESLAWDHRVIRLSDGEIVQDRAPERTLCVVR